MRHPIFSACLLLSSYSFMMPLEATQNQQKARMIRDLEVITHHFEVGYAPLEWKREHAGWEITKAFTEAKEKIVSAPSITTKQFQQIVRGFINSMKDYHADVVFYSTESASLPFIVKGAEGRFFIDWIDVLRLPPSHYSINIGDEIVEFNGEPIGTAIEKFKNEGGKSSNPKTDQALAEEKLTNRSGISGDTVPKGPILIKVRSKSGEENHYQLRWNYTPEKILNSLDFIQSIKVDLAENLFLFEKKKTGDPLPKMKMIHPVHEMNAEKGKIRDGGLGAAKSFIPMLGEPLWIHENKIPEMPEDEGVIEWQAYIYQHPEGPAIGYIRIPHYLGNHADSDHFGEILMLMEENTDALVIDQVHNCGGFVEFAYVLASMLVKDYPLKTPYHRIKITQKEVVEAYLLLELIEMIESTFEISENVNRDDSEEEGETDRGLNYQWLIFLKAYYEFILEEWKEGRSLSNPTPIIGVDQINPHPQYRYTKPIMMLIDEMDFSGGDFMAAILQDNKRAALFGNRTAGAGGYVFKFEFPNTHGIAFCTYTASIAERTNLQKIESLGVSPDIEYEITQEDLQNGYQGYVNAVNQSIIEHLDNHTQ